MRFTIAFLIALGAWAVRAVPVEATGKSAHDERTSWLTRGAVLLQNVLTMGVQWTARLQANSRTAFDFCGYDSVIFPTHHLLEGVVDLSP